MENTSKIGRLRVKTCRKHYGPGSKALKEKRACCVCGDYMNVAEMYVDRTGDLVCSKCSRADMTVSDLREILKDIPPDLLVRFYFQEMCYHKTNVREIYFRGTDEEVKNSFGAVNILMRQRYGGQLGMVDNFDQYTTSDELDEIDDYLESPDGKTRPAS